MDIVEALDPAAGDHRNIDAARQIDRRFDIAAGEHAVAANIGEQDRGDAGIFKTAGEVADADIRDIGPAFGRNHAVPRVHRDNNAAFIFFRHIPDEFRVLERRCTNHQPGHTQFKPALNRLAIANPAAQLHIARKAGDNSLDRFRVAG